VASYTRIDPQPKVPFGEQAFQLGANNNYDAHLAVQYNLLDFGRNQATINTAIAQGQSAADNITVTQRDLAYGAVQVYYGILFLRQSIKVQDEQIASLVAHRNEMQKRVQGGVSTQFDVTTTQVRITQAENTKIDLQNQLHNQQVELARLLHRPEYAEVPVRGSFQYTPAQVNVQAVLAQATQNRPELKLSRDAENTATAQLRLVEKSNLPSLGLTAQAGGRNGYIVPNLERVRPNSIVGAQLSVPIYDGNRNKNQRVEANAQIRAAQARTEETQEQVRADVFEAVNNIQANAARYDNAQVQINQATDAMNRARARYRYGVGTNLDVLDAETQLAQSRLARIQALYNYTIGQYQLKRAAGEQIW
ncbi:MAG TPA: TolC family protein, partial [Hymenobacter sp.]